MHAIRFVQHINFHTITTRKRINFNYIDQKKSTWVIVNCILNDIFSFIIIVSNWNLSIGHGNSRIYVLFSHVNYFLMMVIIILYKHLHGRRMPIMLYYVIIVHRYTYYIRYRSRMSLRFGSRYHLIQQIIVYKSHSYFNILKTAVVHCSSSGI